MFYFIPFTGYWRGWRYCPRDRGLQVSIGVHIIVEALPVVGRPCHGAIANEAVLVVAIQFRFAIHFVLNYHLQRIFEGVEVLFINQRVVLPSSQRPKYLQMVRYNIKTSQGLWNTVWGLWNRFWCLCRFRVAKTLGWE